MITNLEMLWLCESIGFAFDFDTHNRIFYFLETDDSSIFSRVVYLVLANNNIGSIPSEVGLLTNLVHFLMRKLNEGLDDCYSSFAFMHIDREHLLTTFFAIVTTTHVCFLGSNQIGSIPTEIGMMTNLEWLWIST